MSLGQELHNALGDTFVGEPTERHSGLRVTVDGRHDAIRVLLGLKHNIRIQTMGDIGRHRIVERQRNRLDHRFVGWRSGRHAGNAVRGSADTVIRCQHDCLLGIGKRHSGKSGRIAEMRSFGCLVMV